MDMEEMAKTLPQHTCTWLKDKLTMYKYQDVWNDLKFHEVGILAQQTFKASPNDVFLCSYPKTGATWLKALAFAIITREKFDESTSPLLTTVPHECIPFVEHDLEGKHTNSCLAVKATHLNYHFLPKSIVDSNCKIVYLYRNIKDVIVSYYHFVREITELPIEDANFEGAFNEFCEGISWYGPYWDHILGYFKASLEKPETFLFLKYEDMKENPTTNVKRLAEFIGRPFTIEEENAGVIESVIKLCSFKNLSNLKVNKSDMNGTYEFDNKLFFRKAKDEDWKNYFKDEMIEKIDKLIDEKLGFTGLVLK